MCTGEMSGSRRGSLTDLTNTERTQDIASTAQYDSKMACHWGRGGAGGGSHDKCLTVEEDTGYVGN